MRSAQAPNRPAAVRNTGVGEHAFYNFLREFLAFSPWRAGAVVGLFGLTAFLEATGVLMLAPILSLIGVGNDSSAAAHRGFLPDMLASFGLSLSLPAVLLCYLLLVASYSIATSFRDVASLDLQQRFIDHLRRQLFDAIGNAEWSFLAGIHSAEFSHTLSNDLGRLSVGLGTILQSTAAALIALGYIVIALHLSPLMTVATIGIVVIPLLGARTVRRRAERMGKDFGSLSMRVHHLILDFLSGLKLAKSSNAERMLSESFAHHLEAGHERALAFARYQSSQRFIFRLGGAAVITALTYLAIVVVAIPPANAMVLIFVFARLLPLISQSQQSQERILFALPAYFSFAELRARCREAAEPETAGARYQLQKRISCQQIRYRPPGGTDELLRGVTLSIPAQRTTAFIGPSGAGKSTLADLLAGLLMPTEGTISIDGRVLHDRRSWRDTVGYVSQDSFLFNLTVRENLLWNSQQTDDASLWRALDLAAATDFVRQLPQGLDTVLGEHGVRLSGGERQRLAIARALLRRPRLLILDEATSALDRENELRIQQSLAAMHGQLTILIIAHRLATVRCADLIIVLDNGLIAESGPYEELMQAPGGYLRRSELRLESDDV